MINTELYERIGEHSDARLRALASEARVYLDGQRWCRSVADIYFAADYGAIALLASVEGKTEDVDPQVWVITGDVPLSYIDIQSCDNHFEALAAYCILCYIWARTIINHLSTMNCIELTSHSEFKMLGYTTHATDLLPSLFATVDRLIADSGSFESLPEDGKDKLLKIRQARDQWFQNGGKFQPGEEWEL